MGVIVQSHVLPGICVEDRKGFGLWPSSSDIFGDELEVKNRGRQIPLECQGGDTRRHSDLC
jgi:hypothetical protein